MLRGIRKQKKELASDRRWKGFDKDSRDEENVE